MFSSDTKQKHTLNISMILKVPIDLEIEVFGVPPTNNHQAEDKKEDINIFKLIGGSEPEIMINEASLANINENSQALISQLVGRLEQTGKILSTLSQTQHEQENPGNYEHEIEQKCECLETFSIEEFTVIQPQNPPDKKKNTRRLLDSLNDGFVFAVNTMGKVLFLGKLANYSWD
jgi:hypothetical protein